MTCRPILAASLLAVLLPLCAAAASPRFQSMILSPPRGAAAVMSANCARTSVTEMVRFGAVCPAMEATDWPSSARDRESRVAFPR